MARTYKPVDSCQ